MDCPTYKLLFISAIIAFLIVFYIYVLVRAATVAYYRSKYQAEHYKSSLNRKGH